MKNFCKLPSELRSQIWLLTIDPHRTVQVRFKFVLLPDLSDGADFFEAIWDAPPALVYATSPTPVPAALHTCREARHVVAQKYERAFTGGTEPRYVWVNFDLDTISIGKSRFTWMGPEAPRIRWLKFAREMSSHYISDEQPQLRMFTNLDELTIVRHDAETSWDDSDELLYWPCPTERVWFINAETDEKISWAENQRRCDKQWETFVAQNEARGSE
ncbi:hypothetical protein TGAM01_v202059 [Trichoderma gamsii]|uniref:2EXR domain-containing protein n=1 Tax=Trichoderma gamsii TaxID=398673 RepID=A0A2P4ZXF2_9HYPO|nr:hypothetical protein TGAM01_v202059 [Trichoderma gamsii]PON28951.1 hypothetical protein TGAM01_v202059 [Trichoderma gamsii]